MAKSLESQSNIRLVPDPSSMDDLVPMRWVVGFVGGLQKPPVDLVATTNQLGTFNLGAKTFTYTAQGPITIDGAVLAQNETVLFTNQADPTQNLIYTCTTQGVAGTSSTVLTLREDQDSDYTAGISVAVTSGTDNAGKTFRLTTQGTVVIGSTALDWEPYVVPKSTAVFAEDFDASTGTATPGGGMEWDITHNLNSLNVLVQLYDRASGAMIMAMVEKTDPNTIQITFDAEPPAVAGFSAVVIG